MDDRKSAVSVLRGGGILIYPTDTAYGIGCRIDDEMAVEKVFRIRKRPKEKAFTVLAGSMEMANSYFSKIEDTRVISLMENFWPGALTVVYRKNPSLVSDIVTGGLDTVGIRIPDNPLLLGIIGEIGVPILGPSANMHGDPTPFCFEDINPELIKYADFCLKGSVGNEKKVSTVVDCTDFPFKILREGGADIKKWMDSQSL